MNPFRTNHLLNTRQLVAALRVMTVSRFFRVCRIRRTHLRGTILCLLLLGVTAYCGSANISMAATANQAENNTPDQLFAQATAAYSRGDYATAIAGFKRLTEQNGYAPGVLYNLGNSYAAGGATGLSVLSYERALRLDPGNSDIRANLELLRKEAGLFPGEPSFTARLVGALNADQWQFLLLGGLISMTIFAVASSRITISLRLRWGLSGLFLVVMAISATATHYLQQSFNPSVVVKSDVRLLVSPFKGAPPSGAIGEGRLVYPRKSYGDYTLVTDETGRSGWLENSAAIPVSAKGNS